MEFHNENNVRTLWNLQISTLTKNISTLFSFFLIMIELCVKMLFSNKLIVDFKFYSSKMNVGTAPSVQQANILYLWAGHVRILKYNASCKPSQMFFVQVPLATPSLNGACSLQCLKTEKWKISTTISLSQRKYQQISLFTVRQFFLNVCGNIFPTSCSPWVAGEQLLLNSYW